MLVQLRPSSNRFLYTLFGEGAGIVSTARNFLTRPPTGTPRRALTPGEGVPLPSEPARYKNTAINVPSKLARYLFRDGG